MTGGLAARQDKLRAEAEEAWQALRNATTVLECFRCAAGRGLAAACAAPAGASWGKLHWALWTAWRHAGA